MAHLIAPHRSIPLRRDASVAIGIGPLVYQEARQAKRVGGGAMYRRIARAMRMSG